MIPGKKVTWLLKESLFWTDSFYELWVSSLTGSTLLLVESSTEQCPSGPAAIKSRHQPHWQLLGGFFEKGADFRTFQKQGKFFGGRFQKQGKSFFRCFYLRETNWTFPPGIEGWLMPVLNAAFTPSPRRRGTQHPRGRDSCWTQREWWPWSQCVVLLGVTHVDNNKYNSIDYYGDVQCELSRGQASASQAEMYLEFCSKRRKELPW